MDTWKINLPVSEKVKKNLFVFFSLSLMEVFFDRTWFSPLTNSHPYQKQIKKGGRRYSAGRTWPPQQQKKKTSRNFTWEDSRALHATTVVTIKVTSCVYTLQRRNETRWKFSSPSSCLVWSFSATWRCLLFL